LNSTPNCVAPEFSTGAKRARIFQFQLPALPEQLKRAPPVQSRGRHARFAKLIPALIHATMAAGMLIVFRIPMPALRGPLTARRGPTSLHGPRQTNGSGRLSEHQ
jgi:hypothetical protein